MSGETIVSILTICIAFLIVIIWNWLYNRFQSPTKKKIKLDQEFVNNLSTALQNRTIGKYEDVRDYYEGFYDTDVIRFSELKHMNLQLKKVKIKLSNNVSMDKVIREPLLSNIDNRIAEISKKLVESEQLIPFENVPTEERNLLIDLINNSAINSQQYLVKKIDALADLISARNNTVEGLSSENKSLMKLTIYSLVMGGISLVTTITMAVIQLFHNGAK